MTTARRPALVQTTVRLDPIVAAAVEDVVKREGITFTAAFQRLVQRGLAAEATVIQDVVK